MNIIQAIKNTQPEKSVNFDTPPVCKTIYFYVEEEVV